MKLAVAGKGGSGKTSIAGTLARLLARRGYRVLAVDDDPNPNLALTLGLPSETMSAVPALPDEAGRRVNGGVELAKTIEELCASHSLATPDGVTLITGVNPTAAGGG